MAGTLFADGATNPTGTGVVTVNGGTLAGVGQISGAVTMSAGSIAPGDAQPSYTTLTLGSSYTQSSGTLAIAANGSNHSQLAVIGAATLGGTLNVSLSNVPVSGASYTLLTAGSISGTWATTNVTGVPAGWGYKLTYNSTNVVLSMQVPQTLTFAAQASQTFVANGTFSINPLATASSGLAANYTSLTLGVCTVSGATVTMVKAGTCTIAADQAGDANFLAAPQVTQDVAIGVGSQTITFATPAAQTLAAGSISVNPTASSGLAVTLTSNSTAVCTVSGSGPFTIALLSTGNCSLTATQTGDSNYAPATPAGVSFAVGKNAVSVVITGLNPSAAKVGNSVTVSVSVTGTSAPASAGVVAHAQTVSGTSNATPAALPLPTGAVTITDITGTPASCTAVLAGGSGSCAITIYNTGNNTIQAIYNGDASYGASAQPAVVTLAAAPPDPPVPVPMLARWALLLLVSMLLAAYRWQRCYT